MNSSIQADLPNNRLLLTFNGIITKKELEQLYTDVRFRVADLKPDFTVISDFSSCRLMYLNALKTFRNIFHYILTQKSGEVVRVLQPNRIISRQIINASLMRKGYKPIYAATFEEAEEKIIEAGKRDGLRFELHEQTVTFFHEEQKHSGYILNLSTSGCAISSKTCNPELGTTLELEFNMLPENSEKRFKLNAKVVRMESYTFAVSFMDLTPRDKARLWSSLVDHNAMPVK